MKNQPNLQWTLLLFIKTWGKPSSRPVPSILWNGHKNNLLPPNCSQPTPISMIGDADEQQQQ
jgi:hypothetical protein